MTLKIDIRVIPHAEQRDPNSVGDYWWEGDTLHIRASDLGDEGMNLCVIDHEFKESVLCKRAGIPEPDIAEFDAAHPNSSEPGKLKDAPYRKFHLAATQSERQFAKKLGVNWEAYLMRCVEIARARKAA